MTPQDRQSHPAITTLLKDGTPVTLRLLEPGDADALGDFYESISRVDYRHYAPHKLNRTQAALKAVKLADASGFICVIAVNNSGRIVGYAWVDWKDPNADRCGLGICISNAWQGQGTATALMHRLLQIVEQAGPPLVQLTVTQANPRAIALYQKMGFTITGQDTRPPFEEFAADPLYCMERKLR